MVKSMELEPKCLGSSLCLSFLICKVGMIIQSLPPKGSFED